MPKFLHQVRFHSHFILNLWNWRRVCIIANWLFSMRPDNSPRSEFSVCSLLFPAGYYGTSHNMNYFREKNAYFVEFRIYFRMILWSHVCKRFFNDTFFTADLSPFWNIKLSAFVWHVSFQLNPVVHNILFAFFYPSLTLVIFMVFVWGEILAKGYGETGPKLSQAWWQLPILFLSTSDAKCRSL